VSAKTQGREVFFPDVEPWAVEVNGASLLDWIAGTFRRFLALSPGAAEALTLWSVHTHAHDLCEVSPFLVLKSPAMRCGKTSTLLILEGLVPRPLLLSNITPSAVFRAIEKYRPTLLIDEADSFVTAKGNEDLRGLLNSGHRRGGATTVRSVGSDFEPRAFSTWAPRAIASIGSLAATLEDRAVTVPMRRKSRDEVVERMRVDRLRDILGHLRSKAARWVGDHEAQLREADPDVPESLDDRAADNWRPLLAIADTAGGDWPARAREAAKALSLGRGDEGGAKVELLSDLAAIWEARDVDRLPSDELVSALVDLKDRPWSEWNRGRPLSQANLARLLKGFDIRSKDIRFSDGTKKGYERVAFEDAFHRYVPCRGPEAVDVAPLSRLEREGLAAPVSQCRFVALPMGDEDGRGDAWEAES